jgi:hypothetical protein
MVATWKIGSVAVMDRNSFAIPVRVNGDGFLMGVENSPSN